MLDNNRSGMIKVSKNTVAMFNNRGYPRINPKTYELEWYIGNGQFQNRTKAFLEANLASEDIVNNPDYEGD